MNKWPVDIDQYLAFFFTVEFDRLLDLPLMENGKKLLAGIVITPFYFTLNCFQF
jgi:hypothetical protein